MKFNLHEKVVLSVLSKLINSVTSEESENRRGKKKSATKKAKVAAKGTLVKVKKRVRRSAKDAETLRKHVLATKKKNVPVAEIAKKNKITTAYIHQLLARR